MVLYIRICPTSFFYAIHLIGNRRRRARTQDNDEPEYDEFYRDTVIVPSIGVNSTGASVIVESFSKKRNTKAMFGNISRLAEGENFVKLLCSKRKSRKQ